MKFNIYKFNELFFLIGIPVVLVFIWFRGGLMFAGGEEGMPFYNLDKAYQLFSSPWRDFSGGIAATTDLARVPFFWILKNLSVFVPSHILQAMTFLLLMVVGVISVYWLLKITIMEKSSNPLIPVLGAIFYLLNPYSMIQVWGRGLYNQFFPFALLPLFLVLFVLGIKKKNFIYAFLALISSVILSVSFGQPGYVITFWLTIFLYTLFSLLTAQKFADRMYIIFYSLITFILWALMHSWWIWPMFKTIGDATNMLGGLDYNIGSLQGISRESTLPVVIRLLHKFAFVGAYGESYQSLPFRLISWIIPISFIASIGVFKKLRHFKFYLSFFLISLFLVMGTNIPFGFIFLWLFKTFSIFQVFRNPYEKIGLLLMIAYTPFFAIGIIEFATKVRTFLKRLTVTQIVLVMMFLVCGVYAWPMWTGQFAGGVKVNPWTRVPEYYSEANNWIVSQDKSARVLHMPLNPGEGVLAKWEHSYQGIEPSEFIFSNSSISRNVTINKPYYNVLLQRFGVLQKNAFGPDPDISQSEFRVQNLYEELARLNVGFIVLHRDYDEKLSSMKTADETAQYLSKEKNIQKAVTIGALDIYEVKAPSLVNYQKLSPTLYTFEITDAKAPIKLNFLENYNPAWELFVDGGKVDTHTTAFSYANSWVVDQKGSYSGQIKYKVQDYVDEGKALSIIVSKLLIITTILMIFRKGILNLLHAKH